MQKTGHSLCLLSTWKPSRSGAKTIREKAAKCGMVIKSVQAHIIVACASGWCSLLAAQTLQSMGYTDVVSMAGGFNVWSKQGFPIEDGTGEMK